MDGLQPLVEARLQQVMPAYVELLKINPAARADFNASFLHDPYFADVYLHYLGGGDQIYQDLIADFHERLSVMPDEVRAERMLDIGLLDFGDATFFKVYQIMCDSDLNNMLIMIDAAKLGIITQDYIDCYFEALGQSGGELTQDYETFEAEIEAAGERQVFLPTADRPIARSVESAIKLLLN